MVRKRLSMRVPSMSTLLLVSLLVNDKFTITMANARRPPVSLCHFTVLWLPCLILFFLSHKTSTSTPRSLSTPTTATEPSACPSTCSHFPFQRPIASSSSRRKQSLVKRADDSRSPLRALRPPMEHPVDPSPSEKSCRLARTRRRPSQCLPSQHHCPNCGASERAP